MLVFTRRRIISLALSLIAIAGLAYLSRYYDLMTLRGPYMSGWLLFGLFTFLVAFGVRKKVTVIRLGSAYAWSQLHIYLGVVALAVYFMHVRTVVVTGIFENVLAAIALTTIAFGFLGIFLSRVIPPLMHRRGERIFLSRIRGNQAMVRNEIERHVEDAIKRGAGEYFFDFYSDQIAPYFEGIKHIRHHLVAGQKPYEIWDQRFAVAGSYLSPEYQDCLDEMKSLVKQKVDLDFQYVSQWVLKAWLVAHITFSIFLLILVPFHLLLVYSFREG